MKYEIGDKVQFKNSIFIMDAEILEAYKDDEYEDLDYYIKFWDYEGNDKDILVREKDLIGFTKGTRKYLNQELNKLIETYSKEEILEIIRQ